MSSADVDDLLGPSKTSDVDDLLGPAPRRRDRKKVRADGKRRYMPLAEPKSPAKDGIFALRESKGKNLGRTCLICKDPLKSKRGRPPIICGKHECFRAYRNAYRADYDKVRAAS